MLAVVEVALLILGLLAQVVRAAEVTVAIAQALLELLEQPIRVVVVEVLGTQQAPPLVVMAEQADQVS